MAGIFEEGGSDTKSHIKSVFGNMFERKQLRHQPAAEEKTQTEPQISPLMMVRAPDSSSGLLSNFHAFQSAS